MGPIVAQGSIEAALISSNNVSVGIEEQFKEKEEEKVKYETVTLDPLSYMDDVFDINENVKDSQTSNNLMEEFIGSKNLKLNLDKSNFIVIGGSKERRKLKKEIKKNPLMLCGTQMKEVEEVKYLGEIITMNNDESVHKTVLKRIGLAKRSVIEIRSILEDSRAARLGGINVAFHLFESVVLSSIFHNSETWDYMPKKTVKVLDDFFNFFFRKIFRCSTGAPIPNFYWQSGFLRAGYWILKRKLIFCHHLSNLPVNSLGREFFDIQMESSHPSLITEMREHLESLSVPDLKSISKNMWRSKVTKYVINLNRTQLLEDIKRYKKLDYKEFEGDEFKRKEYFDSLDLEGVRMKIKLTSKVVPTIRTHFKRKYKERSLQCPSCKNFSSQEEYVKPDRNFSQPDLIQQHESTVQADISSSKNEYESPLDSSNHLMFTCPAFRKNRENRDMSNDNDLCDFFREIIQYRIDHDEE